ncbi:hypothetical protein [Streptomyces sp. NPDC001401]|uniref:hypothetical protein n=1 Tax=Streptomyces sp. NPDC001401 TaxID=3364570 RepID=UPI0036C90159
MTVAEETSVRRGRHRRPRPRKLLFAVGGLALAAGALSLVRMAPDPGSSGVGTAEADPRQDPAAGAGTGADRSDQAVAAVEAVPRVSPSATSAMGAVSVTPTAPSNLVPLQTATTSPGLVTDSSTTTIPVAPNTPAATEQPPSTTAPAPRPTPTPGRNTPPPASQRGATDEPGLCVPAIGLCVGSLASR